MNFLIITGTPKEEGLSASAVKAAVRGAAKADIEAKVIRLSKREIARCQTCNDGWGTCRQEHECVIKDDFQPVRDDIAEADVVVIQTPVYWGEVSESVKCFMDRFRRCEASKRRDGGTNALGGKAVLLVACPGGSGNGLLSCLSQLERFCQHNGAVIFDYIGVNRWNKNYKTAAIEEAAYLLASGQKAGEDA